MPTQYFLYRAGRFVRAFAILSLARAGMLILTAEKGCGGTVMVPPAESDRALEITIVNHVKGDRGVADPARVTTNETVYVPANTPVEIGGFARNLYGGVNTFVMKFTCWPAGTVCRKVLTSAAPDRYNRVPSILGLPWSGSAAMGELRLSVFTLSEKESVVLDARANNVNAMSTTLHVVYRARAAETASAGSKGGRGGKSERGRRLKR
jgi:hypothetical protein